MNDIIEHISCLGCDEVKKDNMMLLCGHTICRDCLAKYSSINHPKSSIRCDVGKVETKINYLILPLPARNVSEVFLHLISKVQILFGAKFALRLTNRKANDIYIGPEVTIVERPINEEKTDDEKDP